MVGMFLVLVVDANAENFVLFKGITAEYPWYILIMCGSWISILVSLIKNHQNGKRKKNKLV